MRVRSFALTAVALLGSSSAFAAPEERQPAPPQPTARVETILEELASGMRELLRAVVPEVSLPSLEIELPTLELAALDVDR